MPVWALVSFILKGGKTPKQVSDMWLGEITEEEVEAALAYTRQFPQLVMYRLADED